MKNTLWSAKTRKSSAKSLHAEWVNGIVIDSEKQ